MADDVTTKADLKAWLAGHGATLQPDADLKFYEKPKPETGAQVVIVDRVRAGWTPPYCIHGYATCVGCDNMCYLGSETQKLCSSGAAYPLCQPCVNDLVDAGRWSRERRTRVHDHLRTDGPH